ncbi:hypothetical protein POM88_003167 [Heracleum sosnowskyi]|uniref:Uncharacterized protein n=1 Tax=Heracleum sosnowskyi TaxID=360622 RepID=A0AAD8NC07_9APIA|nr:hypothetical protein POM88_003167 [Heracleum sosnowskyi]
MEDYQARLEDILPGPISQTVIFDNAYHVSQEVWDGVDRDPERESFHVAEYWARSTVVKETSEGKGKGKVSEEEVTEGTWTEAGKDKGKKKRKVIEEDNEELKGKGKEKAKGKENGNGKGKGKKKGIVERT